MKILSVCGSPRKGKQQGTTSAQVLLKIAELGEKYKVKGPKDAAKHHDKYLYGKDWSR